MALDVYSSGLAIEPLLESINKLTYGEEVDSFIEVAADAPDIGSTGFYNKDLREEV